MTAEQEKTRICGWCNKVLKQKPGESKSNFEKRNTCDKVCSGFLREAKKSWR